jgi:hypothetical protein
MITTLFTFAKGGNFETDEQELYTKILCIQIIIHNTIYMILEKGRRAFGRMITTLFTFAKGRNFETETDGGGKGHF